jgi:hypothetical protein
MRMVKHLKITDLWPRLEGRLISTMSISTDHSCQVSIPPSAMQSVQLKVCR